MLLDIETKASGTIRVIALAAVRGHAKTLNALAETLGKLDKAMLLDIETQAPGTVNHIAKAARNGLPAALNNIAAALGLFDKDELVAIEAKAPGTVNYVAAAARYGHPAALNNIAAALGLFDKDELVAIEAKAPGTIRVIAFAAAKGHAETLNALAETLGKLNKAMLLDIETQAPGTVNNIALAAVEGHAETLNALAETQGKLDKAMLLDIVTQAPGTVNNIAEAATTGHPKAFLAVLDYFLIVENNKPKCNLPKCIKDSIRQGKYGRGLSFVMVAAEIKKRYPSHFKIVFTNKFIDVIEWYDSITALDKFGDILDYIKKTVLNYNNQDAAQWSIKFLDKLIEFYDESKPCSIGVDMPDFYDFIKKIECYKSQCANGTHSDKKSVENQLVDFMAPTSEHVVASNGLFSEHYCALRDKYKTLVGINKSAGGLLHLEQCETLFDAHNEIVELFRHFILCLQDDLSASQMTFCYDDIDNFLRRYDFAEASQLLLADLQYLDRHNSQHALFKAHS